VILELLALASLLRLDPAGDAYGAGDLVAPSAALYADPSSFDLIEVEALGDDALTVRIRLAGIPDPGGLPNGLTLPVVDVYLDLADGGEEASLPGVGMAFPVGRGWEVALRLHGDRAYLVRADDPTRRERPVTVERRGDELIVVTDLPAPEEIRDLQAVTGVYDPFSPDAWRPLASVPSPWAFASEVPAPPVVDLLAESDELQRDALRTYLLPPSRNERGPVGWLLAMFVGLGLAAAGLWLRRHVPPGDEGSARDAVPSGDGVPASDAASPGDGVPAGTEPPDAAAPVGAAVPLDDGSSADDAAPVADDAPAVLGTGLDPSEVQPIDADELEAADASSEAAPRPGEGDDDGDDAGDDERNDERPDEDDDDEAARPPRA
jgi:hypothetical protein